MATNISTINIKASAQKVFDALTILSNSRAAHKTLALP